MDLGLQQVRAAWLRNPAEAPPIVRTALATLPAGLVYSLVAPQPFANSMLLVLITLLEAAIRRRPAEANPWGEGATTLEWTLSSPPPFHQFSTLPVIK